MNGEKLKLKIVSYSSQYSTSYPATNAIDGSTSTRWRTVNNPSYPQYLIVELEDFYSLCGFRIYPGTDSYRPSSFKILASVDGLEYNEVYSGNCSSTASFLEFEFPNTEFVKYVKIELTGAASNRLYVYEVELYGIYAVRKYLLRKDSTIYTVIDNILTPVESSGLTAEVFKTYGLDEVPECSIITELTNPEILYWQDNVYVDPKLTVNMTATPPYQNVITNSIDLTDPTITGIESMTVNCEGNPLIAVSFDDKVTWHAWNGEQWSVVSEEFSGMTKELAESITYNNWLTLYTGASSFYIRVSFTDTETKLTEIYVDFAN